MKSGGRVASDASTAAGAPLIVFHGDADSTVHALNGSLLVDAVLGGDPAQSTREMQPRRCHRPLLHPHRLLARRQPGPSRAEHWIVHGAGHAWVGGDAAGSYADGDGPDASREMLRFFAEHPRKHAERSVRVGTRVHVCRDVIHCVGRVPVNTRSLLLAAALALASSAAEAEPAHLAIAALPLDHLKTAYLACDRAASESALSLSDFQRCGVVGDELLKRGFGGDFDRLLAWWRARETAPARIETSAAPAAEPLPGPADRH